MPSGQPRPRGTRRRRNDVEPEVGFVSRSRAIGPRPIGKIDRPSGPFRLAPGLAGPGALSIADAVGLVTADWREHLLRGELAQLTFDRHTEGLERFVMYAAAFGVLLVADVDGVLCQKWCTALKANGQHAARASTEVRARRSAVSSRHSRRSLLHSFFLTCHRLGLTDRDPSVGVVLPPRPHSRWSRPLTDQEAAWVWRAAHRTVVETRHPVTVGLALHGLTTAELPALRVRDCWPDQHRVWAHGGATRTAARWVEIDQKTADAVARRIEHLAGTVAPEALPDTLLVYTPTNPNTKPETRQCAAASQLLKVLRQAGLGDDESLHAGSYTAYAAQRLWQQTGSLRQVAAALGLSSLDTTADLLGLDWRVDCQVAGPAGVPTPNTPLSYAGVPRPGDDTDTDDEPAGDAR